MADVTLSITVSDSAVESYINAVGRVRKAERELQEALDVLTRAVYDMSSTLKGKAIKSDA